MCDLQNRVVPNAKEAERPDIVVVVLIVVVHVAIVRVHVVSIVTTVL